MLKKYIIKVVLLLLIVHFSDSIAQTVEIGGSSGIEGEGGPIWMHRTGNTNISTSVQVVRQQQLIESGIVPGSVITEWGFKKMSSSAIFDNDIWEVKVYLKNADFPFHNMFPTSYSSLKNNATLIHQSIVTKHNFPVVKGFWLWQAQDVFQYTGNDIFCFVEFTPISSPTYNNITQWLKWEKSLNSGTHSFQSAYNTGTQHLINGQQVTFTSGFNTRITYLTEELIEGLPNAGTISSSVSNANSGAPFVLLASGLSHGFDMVYQWQKSPSQLNQWENLGEVSSFPSKSAVLQDEPTDYRLISTCTTTNQSSISNSLSIGQNQNVLFIDPFLKTAILRITENSGHAKNLQDQNFAPDANDDGEIQIEEAMEVSEFSFTNTVNTASGVSTINDTANFLNLKSLGFGNGSFPNVVVPNLPLLESFSMFSCGVQNIVFPELQNLKYLSLSNNQLTTIDLINLPQIIDLRLANNLINNIIIPESETIRRIFLNNNLLTTLSVNNTPDLDHLNCEGNLLTSLSVTGINSFQSESILGELNCSNNQLVSLNIENVDHIAQLKCNNNFLEELDLSKIRVQGLYCQNNNLNNLNIRNGFFEFNPNFSNNPNLEYICADGLQIETIRNLAITYGYNDLNINDYCSFDNVGEFKLVYGMSTYNETQENCEESDIVYPNLKLKWFEDFENELYFLENLYSKSNGEIDIATIYLYNYLLQPELENPEYFNVYPETFSYNFENGNSINQNFCITPNGSHHDVEVVFFPLSEARPGFDAIYRILLKNKGTEVSSGQITLDYEDNVMDLISSEPMPLSNSNNQMIWEYQDLMPFETRSIKLLFSLNTPGSTHPLNDGDVLDFYLVANTTEPDEYLLNNAFLLNHGAVNSYDPNDKTCLQGNVVGPELIGEYVHYLIRFENTGSASAINVVVKDVIDSSKFNINSLIPLEASHPFAIRQKENSFEFVFENINLPFEDAENDGFIMFKIKLLNELNLNDEFSNHAEIYFDYNFPIVTNNEITVIQLLNNADFNSDDTITVYPNPLKDIVNIAIKNNSTIKTIELYDVQGRLLQTQLVNNITSELNLSSRANGMYFIKINTDKGSKVEKLVKK